MAWATRTSSRLRKEGGCFRAAALCSHRAGVGASSASATSAHLSGKTALSAANGLGRSSAADGISAAASVNEQAGGDGDEEEGNGVMANIAALTSARRRVPGAAL